MPKKLPRVLAVIVFLGFSGAVAFLAGYQNGWAAGKRGEYRAIYGSAAEKIELYGMLKDVPPDHTLRETLRRAIRADIRLLRVLGEQVRDESRQRLPESPVTWFRTQQQFAARPLEPVEQLETRASKVLERQE